LRLTGILLAVVAGPRASQSNWARNVALVLGAVALAPLDAIWRTILADDAGRLLAGSVSVRDLPFPVRLGAAACGG
jgi:hypothetical protein